MGADELVNEEAFSQDKLFDDSQFSTLIVNREGFNKRENSTADLIESLLEKGNTRQEDEQIFAKLKEAGAGPMLVNAISAAKRTEEKIKLTAACWESGLDFTPFFLDFVALTMDKDFQLALEALSVVESIEGQLDETTLTKALQITESVHSPNTELVNDLISTIKSRIA